MVFGREEGSLVLVYLWTQEARETAIADLDGAVIEGTMILRVRKAEKGDLERALQMQKGV